MRGARHFRPDVSSRLKKCSEHIGDDCTDCCSVVFCSLCLELEIYGEEIVYGHAPESAKHWTGTVGGYSFDAFWERDFYDDICYFVVEFGGEEVYREPCGYISCRDASDEVAVTVIVDGYEVDATLRWRKHEPLELQHATNYETGCKTFFCDECECSCDTLCITIIDETLTEVKGELDNISYPCDPPIWEGTVAGYDLSLALDRDEYGQCVIVPAIDGYETNPVLAPGCSTMSATFEVETGITATVTCKICDCEETGCPCCPGWTLGASGSVVWTTTNVIANDCDPTVPGPVEVTGDFGCPQDIDPEGTIVRSSEDILRIRVYCEEGATSYTAQYKSAATAGVWTTAVSEIVCPDCADSVGGITTGAIDFTAQMQCDTSGGPVVYDILVHGEIEVGC